MEIPGATRDNRKEYDVALSFAGEDRDFVEGVATALRRKGLRVFYDKFEEVDLVGRNLIDHLSSIYQEKATLCVLFISEAYARKPFPRMERQAAQATALVSDDPYIIPVRLDNSNVPGLLPTVAYLSGKSPEAIANVVAAKILLREPRGIRVASLTRGDYALVRFSDFLEPDQESFRESLKHFAHWAESKRSSVPIELRLPSALTDYIEKAKSFRSTKSWMARTIGDDARRQFSELFDKRIPSFLQEMMRGTQIIIGHYTPVSQDRLDFVVRRFLMSKITVLYRLLLDFRLKGMESPDWSSVFSSFETVWSDSVIYGLAYACYLDGEERFFWIDADGCYSAPNVISSPRHRLYMPAEFAISDGRASDRRVSTQSFDQFFAVQLLEDDLRRAEDSSLGSFVQREENLELTIRGEWAIESDHFSQVSTMNNGGRDLFQAFSRLRDHVLVQLKDRGREDNNLERWVKISRLGWLVRDRDNFREFLET